MNLPEPVAWRVKDDEASDHYGKSIHAYYDSADIRLDHPNAEKLTALLESLYTEAQIREALAHQEAVMRHVLDVLGPQAPLCCGCTAEWNESIKALEDALK